LSISSMKTMPFCSVLCRARVLISSSLTSLPASSSTSSCMASAIFSLRLRRRSCPIWLNMLRSCSVTSSMPLGPMISMVGRASARSISISRSFKLPSRSFLRKTWRAALSGTGAAAPSWTARAGGMRMSRMRSSAASSARMRCLRISVSRVCLTAISIRSRMMESTSLPT